MQRTELSDFGTKGDKRFWFIAWVGSVNKSPSGHSPKIEVLLYPLLDDVEINEFKGLTNQLDLKAFRESAVDVGLLPLFSIGCIVKDDILVYTPKEYLKPVALDFLGVQPRLLNILTADSFMLHIGSKKIGKGVSAKEVTFPVYGFPLIKYHKAYVACIPKESFKDTDFDFVIIPCPEYIRKYFSSSDNIVQALFGGFFNSKLNPINRLYYPESLISKERIENGEPAQIKLKREMVKVDAKIIARIAYSQDALFAANSIYNESQLADFKSARAYPKCQFPFSSKSSLTVYGRTIKANGKNKEFTGKKIFLVYRIERCNGAYPYNRLIATKDGFVTTSKNEELPKTEVSIQPSVKLDPNDNVTITSNAPRNYNARKHIVQIENEDPNEPLVEFDEVAFQETNQDVKILPSPVPDNFTVSTETGNNPETGQVEIQAKQKRKKKKSQEIVESDRQLKSGDQYEVFFKDIVSRFELNTERFKVVFNCDGKDNYKHFKSGLSNWSKGRKAYAVQINEIKTNRFFFLFDWFKKTHEKKSSGGKILCIRPTDKVKTTGDINNLVDAVMTCCATNKRVWLNNKQHTEYERIMLRHLFDHPMTTYNSIIKFLEKGKISL